MEALNRGSSKVVLQNHTLILGWNEATTRTLCQIAFLRRVFMAQNETLPRRLLPFLRVKPSTPVACNPVVVMNDTMPKAKMEAMTKHSFAVLGIKPKRTKVRRSQSFLSGARQKPPPPLRTPGLSGHCPCLLTCRASMCTFFLLRWGAT